MELVKTNEKHYFYITKFILLNRSSEVTFQRYEQKFLRIKSIPYVFLHYETDVSKFVILHY